MKLNIKIVDLHGQIASNTLTCFPVPESTNHFKAKWMKHIKFFRKLNHLAMAVTFEITLHVMCSPHFGKDSSSK